MLKTNRFLAVDIGASTLKLAEFESSRAGALILKRFNYAEVVADPATHDRHSPITTETVRELMEESGVKVAPVMLSVPGQSVFTRFVKLPAVEEGKVAQIIQYEAQQNVPFPIEEVVWDYQLIGGGHEEELEVVLVAIKSEIIEELTDTIISAHLPLHVVDVAPMSLYNAARFNYPEWFAPDAKTQECVVLLDIGARTSNLVFVEGNKIFSRSISIGGNTITQAIASELSIPFDEAEKLKRQKGIVGLGGAYEEPADETQAHLGKIVRNIITQLHADVNRTVNFYRTQRGGSAPSRLLLSGGACIMPYLDRFFHESLRVPVEYFNPFRNVQLAPAVSREELSQCAHFFGEVVGVALRRAMECPIQVSLMPPKIEASRTSLRRIPYLVAGGACLFVTLLCWSLYYYRVATQTRIAAERLTAQVQGFSETRAKLTEHQQLVVNEEERLAHLTQVVEARTAWTRILEELNDAVSHDNFLWLTSVKPIVRFAAQSSGGPVRGGTSPPPAVPATSVPVISELIVEGMGVADLRTPGNNVPKVENFMKRLVGGGESGEAAGVGESGASRERAASMFETSKDYTKDYKIMHPPMLARDEYEKNAFRFTATVKLKKPIWQ